MGGVKSGGTIAEREGRSRISLSHPSGRDAPSWVAAGTPSCVAVIQKVLAGEAAHRGGALQPRIYHRLSVDQLGDFGGHAVRNCFRLKTRPQTKAVRHQGRFRAWRECRRSAGAPSYPYCFKRRYGYETLRLHALTPTV